MRRGGEGYGTDTRARAISRADSEANSRVESRQTHARAREESHSHTQAETLQTHAQTESYTHVRAQEESRRHTHERVPTSSGEAERKARFQLQRRNTAEGTLNADNTETDLKR